MSEGGRYDLIVIGGGPAGSTLATLVKKHAPERRVLLLEKTPFPRHHVGESLLPGIVPVLKEMGVFEKIDAAGFPKKVGANYLWGRGDEVWENDFNEVNLQAMLDRYGTIPERIEYAWQVRRSAYDKILLDHARALGVEVREGFAASDIVEEAGRIAGVTGTDTDGARRTFRGAMLADCSGQNGFLSRFKKIREYDPALKNMAVYAYWKGARWKYAYSGHPDKTKIFICSTPNGWFWYIPIDADIVSVGFVTSVAHVKASRREPRELYLAELKACAEIAPLLECAEQMQDFEGTGQDLFTQSDWSYLNVAASGPGWLAAGDAAVFVDPILSTGVTLAHTAAHRAAYTLLTDWAAEDENTRALLWPDYDRFCRESAAQYLALALFWYGNDRRAQVWWKRAGELHRALMPVPGTDKAAFVTVTAGLTRYYDRVLNVEEIGREEVLRPEQIPFYESVLKGEATSTILKDSRPTGAPRLLCAFVTEIIFLPAGPGRLKPVKRVRFLKHSEPGPVADAMNPRRPVTRWHLQLLAALDGRRTLGQLQPALIAEGVPDWWLGGPATRFLEDLELQGVLAFDAAPVESAA